jgi:dihydrofolate synthase / folylpolyglutamate synthase
VGAGGEFDLGPSANPGVVNLTWDYEDAEAYLASLEPIGWRLGLDRIRRLTSALGMPQHRFASVHVVGTNGKSSVTQMTAALLDAHGVSAGAYLSPHVRQWSERIRIRGAEIGNDELAAAIERTAQSAEAVNRALDEGDAVTQFEAITAAAFMALAASGVEVGVIEAGLGGRLDATNVIPSRVTALTSVGLEHTEWLGETETEIAAEKLAVLRDHSTLVVGVVGDEVEELAERFATERGASLVRAEPGPRLTLRAPGRFQRRNFAVALAAARAILGRLDVEVAEWVAAELELPGRLELREGDPPAVLDAAHNPHGAGALAEALPDVADGRPVVACMAMLEKKDAESVIAALAPAIEYAVATQIPPERLSSAGRPGARTIAAEQLAKLCRDSGIDAEAVTDPVAAVERAREVARERAGIALFTGSHYLLAYG